MAVFTHLQVIVQPKKVLRIQKGMKRMVYILIYCLVCTIEKFKSKLRFAHFYYNFFPFLEAHYSTLRPTPHFFLFEIIYKDQVFIHLPFIHHLAEMVTGLVQCLEYQVLLREIVSFYTFGHTLLYA